MATVANSSDSIAITSGLVAQSVGLCYFDPIEESFLELSNLPNHFITVEPHRGIIRKYYLIVDPGATVSYIRVRVVNNDLDRLFSIKTIIGDEAPQVGSFEALPEYNSFRVNNPDPGAFVPVWILIESKTPLNEILDMQIEVEYE